MQDFLAILIVALAAAFLARRAWQNVTRRASGHCSSCANCRASYTSLSQPLVTLTPIKPLQRSGDPTTGYAAVPGCGS